MISLLTKKVPKNDPVEQLHAIFKEFMTLFVSIQSCNKDFMVTCYINLRIKLYYFWLYYPRKSLSLSRPTDLVSVKSVIKSIETSQTITDIPTASIDSRLNQSETDSKLQLELQSEDVSLTEVSQLTHSTIESSAITTSAMTTKPTTASQARVQHFFRNF